VWMQGDEGRQAAAGDGDGESVHTQATGKGKK